jgi:ATP-dependent Clp protease ATP-binding subunit ClpA
MFDRFSPNLIKTIAYAEEEARGLGHTQVAPGHLFLGLIRITDDRSAELLRQLGVVLPTALREMKILMGSGSETSSHVNIQLGSDSKKLLKSAWEESQRRGTTECGTEHLLIAIIRADIEVIKEVLKRLGVEITCEEVEQLVTASNIREDNDVLKLQISAWHNRAEMARIQGNDDLVRQALEQKCKYEKLLGESKET